MGLDRYRRMRDFSRTAEPSGKVRRRKGWSFVVQKHAASHLHYDFRLELDGVLKSWSVPKGPTFDTREKRLAVQTEDHPVEYGSFEGIIPEGEYGGGTVMLWDRGSWEPIGDPQRGMEKGHLEFLIRGERLKGKWTLVRLRRKDTDRGKDNWLLFKRSDEHADPGEEITETALTSVATGRTLDEIAEATGKTKKVWHSNRAAGATSTSTVRSRIRAAAREGRVKRGEPAKKKPKAASALRTTEDAPRKWDVAPREGAYRGPTAKRRAAARDTTARVPVAGVKISNGDRIIDPGTGTTKLELARYYEAVAKPFLVHGGGRPLALVRCPEGAAGECFFQKHSHPGMATTIHVDVDAHGEELLSVTTVAGVVSLAQWGAVELHAWGSRVASLETPDWIVMDFDPGPGVRWAGVVDAALTLRERLLSLGLESFVKTTGGKGLHVVVPVTRRHDWDTLKSFSHALALDMVDREPSKYVATMSKHVREGRIFVDYLRNGRGSTAILPYSARARDALTVSMPIEWSTLEGAKVDPLDFTVATVPGILARRKKDPWAGLRRTRQSITRKVLDGIERG